jgi:hypothetical protein
MALSLKINFKKFQNSLNLIKYLLALNIEIFKRALKIFTLESFNVNKNIHVKHKLS